MDELSGDEDTSRLNQPAGAHSTRWLLTKVWIARMVWFIRYWFSWPSRPRGLDHVNNKLHTRNTIQAAFRVLRRTDRARPIVLKAARDGARTVTRGATVRCDRWRGPEAGCTHFSLRIGPYGHVTSLGRAAKPRSSRP